MKKHPANYKEDTDDYISQIHQESFHQHDVSDFLARLGQDELFLTLPVHDKDGHTHYQIQMDYHLYNTLSHSD